jgi:two-component system chemotaxis response regulator CheY
MAKTVLITDDTAFMRMTLRNVIEKNGYEVVGEAANGEEAITLYQELKPDLVTMDITMPKVDGITASRRL